MKMENKAENCNLTSSMQLYEIEKKFQQPRDMLTALESPDIKARYFPNFKWIQSFLAGGNCFSMQLSNEMLEKLSGGVDPTLTYMEETSL